MSCVGNQLGGDYLIREPGTEGLDSCLDGVRSGPSRPSTARRKRKLVDSGVLSGSDSIESCVDFGPVATFNQDAEGVGMAFVSEFREVVSDTNGLHKPVICGWRKFDVEDRTILQLDTYGTAQRQIPNKVSQSVQLDREGAAVLLRLIRDTFGEL